MIQRFKSMLLLLLAGLSISDARPAAAQDNASAAPIPLGISSPAANPDAAQNAPPEGAAPAEAAPAAPASGEINPNDIPSLLFTFWEHKVIVDAKNSRDGRVRPPSQAEINQVLGGQGAKPKPPPEEREIRLAGIVYVTNDDWTIWLNGKRVTPKAIPREVLDLKVRKEYIEMKWIDDYTNQIFPIRLRPHQRFNIDTRIFLPG